MESCGKTKERPRARNRENPGAREGAPDSTEGTEESAMGTTKRTDEKQGNLIMRALRRLRGTGANTAPEAAMATQSARATSEGRACRAQATYCAADTAPAPASREASRRGVSLPARSGRRRRVLGAAMTACLAAAMAMAPAPALADDTANTVPSDEGYSSTVNSIHGRQFNVSGVYQSNSGSSITSFGSALPLSTIYINQSKIWADVNSARPVESGVVFTQLTTDPGIKYYPTAASSPIGQAHYVAYDPRVAGATQLVAGQENTLPGDLFSLKFPDAAEYTDANGNIVYGDVEFKYSNAKIFIDQRYMYYPGRNYLNGLYSLATGAKPTWGTNDTTDLSSYNSYVNDVITSIKNKEGVYENGADDYSGNTNLGITYKAPQVGGSIDITISVKNKEGVPVPGTFVIATTGVNLDRSPRRGDGNNVNKAMWYYYKGYRQYHYFSEAMSVNGGQFAQNIYVRNNNNNMKDTKSLGAFYPYVTTDSNGKIKFISDATGNKQSSDGSYTSGFVTLGNAATGLSVTSTGHAGNSNGGLGAMNSPFFNSSSFWYKYKSSTGPNGNIQITQEGNHNGDLSLTGTAQDAVLGQGTYVVMEGKTVKYTMTPDTGYKISTLQVAGSEVKFDQESVKKMKKGDTTTHTTAAGETGTLTYNEDGTYTFEFPYAKADEAIHVTWERTTADILYAKIWDDSDDKDGMRKGAYNTSDWPQVKLQQSLDGGASWTDVTVNANNATISAQDVPSGQTGNAYKDGSYDKNNDTTGNHPFTWEYLPVYTYDSNGKADRQIQYRIVEGTSAKLVESGYSGTDPALTGYKTPQYADGQTFYLTSENSKTWDGWLIYTNANGTKNYMLKNGKYYDVDTNGKVGSISSPQPAPATLKSLTSNEYRTVDKAIPYQSVSVKNEHTVSDIYVEVLKEWNDASLFGKTATDGNAYSRRNITFTLHGTINNGTAVVDLTPGDGTTTDKTITLTPTEAGAKQKQVGGYNVVRDVEGTRYALNTNDNQYYKLTSAWDALESTPVDPQPRAANLYPVYNTTFKVDDDNFGVVFDGLQAYEAGELITYTVTESFGDAGAWSATGGTLTAVTESGAVTGYTMSDLTKVEKNEDLLGYTAKFVNTPIVDDEYTPLPVTINKKDAYTNANLEGAIFTVYTDPFNKIEPATSKYKQIDGLTVWMDGSDNQYVLKDGEYYAVTNDVIASAAANPQPTGMLTKVENENFRTVNGQTVWTDKQGHNYILQSGSYYEVDADGNVASAAADPQPAATDLSKIKTAGAVDEIHVITDASGSATINFNETGTYYIVETAAPDGYQADATMYKFEVDKQLKKVELKSSSNDINSDADHDTPWWERLWNLIFGSSTNTESNWNQASNNMSGTLTVTDTPLTANILVRKTWDDANDQDGKRPTTAADLPTLTLQYTTDDITDSNVTPTWNPAQVYDTNASSLVNVDTRQVTNTGGAINADANNAYTWIDLPAYRDGKVVYYRVQETSPIITNGTYAITKNRTVSSNEENFKLVNASLASTNQIVEITNTHVPQTLTIDAIKYWNDNNNAAGKRPSTLEIRLYKTVNNIESRIYTLTLDGVADATQDVAYEVAKTDDNHWKAVFKQLPAFEGGSPILYRLEEVLDDTAKISYVNSYSVAYTKTDDTSVATDNEDSILANDVKRAFAAGEETTSATITVSNISKNNVDATKYWLGGANANVRFTLFRSTNPDQMVEQGSTAAPIKSGGIITIGSDTYDVYVHANGKKYVDKSTTSTPEWHEILDNSTQDPSDDSIDSNVAIIKITTWTPYQSDGTMFKNNWEAVPDGSGMLQHLFVSSAFSASMALPGDDESHAFQDLPALDANGNSYTYRILETNTAGDTTDTRFEAHYSPDGLSVTNINKLVEEGTANVDVLKDLQGRSWQGSDAFYFYIDPIKAVDDSTGAITEFTDEEADDKAAVPKPSDGHQYGRALGQNTAVGSTSREVSFAPMLFDSADVPQNTTKTYYYKVYESGDANGNPVHQVDDKGITYDGTIDNTSGVWSPKVMILKVVATADANNVITTTHEWAEYKGDGTALSWTTETPVFRNTYASKSDAKIWIEKELASRAWQDYDKNNGTGDAYQFTVNSISGAPLDTPNADDGAYHTMPLVSNATNNPQSDLQNYDTTKWAFGITGNPITGDELDSNGQATFIYEVFENDKVNSTTNELGTITDYAVDGVEYDARKIYIKATVKDNWDGTLSFDVHYYSDASCKSKYEITGNQLWIEDKTEIQYVSNVGSTVIKTESEYANLSEAEKNKYKLTKVQTKRLLDASEITRAE